MKKRVLIGLSWPYANNRLHIGGIASSLPADAIARYHRMIGNDVSFVTGSDCYGTPIMVSAERENTTPENVANKYHAFHDADFRAMGFTFTLYDKTLSKRHHEFVKQFHTEMYRSDLIYEKTEPRLYCDHCKKFLPDRYVEGICPHCKKPAKGDSCDHCGQILEPEDLIDPKCILCGTTPKPQIQTQMYLKLSALQGKIQHFFDDRKDKWTTNAVGLTQRYLNEGLQDRAITRSLAWGIDIPKKGWDDRKIYIWAENVLGYFSASEPEFRADEPNALHYYVHGKDNIPFHSIILPALIMARNGTLNAKTDRGLTPYHLPDIIVASEYVNVGGEKMSKSKGNIIPVHVMHENFDVDMVRFFLLRIINDKRDANFTWEEFVNVINGELVNNYGNLVNRTLSFAKTKFGGRVRAGAMDEDSKSVCVDGDVAVVIENAKKEWHELMPLGHVAAALKVAMDLVNFGNKYFADKKPWSGIDCDPRSVVGDVTEIIRAATYMLTPFIPNACGKVALWLGGDGSRGHGEIILDDIEVLFQRLELSRVMEIVESANGKK